MSKDQFSMIEISLVPDVKKELLIAQKIRNQISLVAIIIASAVMTLTLILVMFIYIYQVQKLNSLEKEGNRVIQQVSNIDGIDQVLTIQNQLNKLDEIHQSKPISSRMFMLMVSLIEGNNLNVTISGLKMNPHNNQIVIEGRTEDGYVVLEKLQKTILDTKVKYELINSEQTNNEEAEEPKEHNLTKHVALLSSPSFGEESGKTVLRFEIGFVIQEDFFKNKSGYRVVLSNPDKKDVTDSSLSIPENIFSKKAEE